VWKGNVAEPALLLCHLQKRFLMEWVLKTKPQPFVTIRSVGLRSQSNPEGAVFVRCGFAAWHRSGPRSCLPSTGTLDCDLGKSGSQSGGRDGFQQLVSEVALAKRPSDGVEVSRLARNSAIGTG